MPTAEARASLWRRLSLRMCGRRRLLVGVLELRIVGRFGLSIGELARCLDRCLFFGHGITGRDLARRLGLGQQVAFQGRELALYGVRLADSRQFAVDVVAAGADLGEGSPTR